MPDLLHEWLLTRHSMSSYEFCITVEMETGQGLLSYCYERC